MDRYVFYQTNKSAWICHSERWKEYIYNKEITPIRMSILECTDKCIWYLVKVLEKDRQEFIDIILKEIADDPLAIYSN